MTKIPNFPFNVPGNYFLVKTQKSGALGRLQKGREDPVAEHTVLHPGPGGQEGDGPVRFPVTIRADA